MKNINILVRRYLNNVILTETLISYSLQSLTLKKKLLEDYFKHIKQKHTQKVDNIAANDCSTSYILFKFITHSLYHSLFDVCVFCVGASHVGRRCR